MPPQARWSQRIGGGERRRPAGKIRHPAESSSVEATCKQSPHANMRDAGVAGDDTLATRRRVDHNTLGVAVAAPETPDSPLTHSDECA